MTDGKAGKGIFQVRHLHIDTLSERVLFIHEEVVQAVIVDNIAVAVKALAKLGVNEINVAVVHPIFARGALRHIKAAGG
jgi:hypothetical protein